MGDPLRRFHLVAAIGLARGPLLATFGLPGFAGVWASAAAGSFARITVQVVLSWITLEQTGSPFLVGVVLAARMAPQMLVGIPAGILADWVDRRTLVVAVNAISATAVLGLAGLAGAGLLSLPWILVAAVGIGALDTLRTTATQAYAYDLVRATRATSGMALTNLGGQLLGTMGGLVGGYALERFGGAAAFGLAALALLTAAAFPSLWGPAVEAAGPTSAPARPNLWHAATLLARNRLVAVLALAVVLAEVLGFSGQTLLPTFARDVFEVGAAGLGTMTALRSAGGVVGLLVLARLGTGNRSGAVLLATCGSLGLALVAFAATPVYGLAVVLLAVVGAASSAMDTLGQTLIQRNVADRERGAAMGIWVFSIGSAPVGHLALGAAATTLGAPLALAASGALLVVVAAALALNAPLRRAR